MMKRKTNWTMLAAAILLGLGLLRMSPNAHAQPYDRTFPETGKTVSGALLEYYITHGGVPRIGYPISEPFQEQSAIDGKTYPVQYFQRAELEMHPENTAPYDVMPALLGNMVYDAKYPGGAPNQQASTVNPVKFQKTGKTLGGGFRKYWEQNGGLAQFGYPISDEFQEKSSLDGQTYPVQYFQRAELELHPSSQPSTGILAARFAPVAQTAQTNQVMASQLGTQQMQSKYPNGAPAAQPAPIPSPVPGCVSRLVPGKWSGPLVESMTMTGDYTGSGTMTGTTTLNVVCNGAFTGTTTVTEFKAKGGKGGITLANCSPGVKPVATYTGKQEVRPDGLYLLITGGRFTQGTVVCKIPFQPNRVENLTGRTIDATDVKVETVSGNTIGGSQWIGGAVNNVLLEEIYKVDPKAKVDVASKGKWVLKLEK